MIEYYEDAKGEHRWRVTHPNGNIIGASTEGYKKKEDAEDNLLSMMHTVAMDLGLNMIAEVLQDMRSKPNGR